MPATLNVRPSAAPAAMFGVVQLPSSRVAVCGAAPVLVKAMTWPTFAVIAVGSKAKSLTLTATSPGSVVSSQAAPAAGADAGWSGARRGARGR